MREDRVLAVGDAPAASAPPDDADPQAGPAHAIDGEVDVDASALRFVYAFTFDGDSILERVRAIDSAEWRGGRQPLKVWHAQEFSTADLLSHVAAFLHPPDASTRTAALWRMDERALRSPAGLGGGEENPGAAWTLATRHGDIEFVLQGVELALFRHGVGFLTAAVRPVSSGPAAWFDFIHHFRFIAGNRAAEVRATRAVAPAGGTAAPNRIDYFPAFAGAPTGGPERHWGEIVDGLLRQGMHDGDTARWWEEIFVPGMLLPYASLFVDRCDPDRAGEMLFRLRNFFHSRQDVHPAMLDAGDDRGILPYSDKQWFFFSLNGGGFLGRDVPATPFFRTTLPAHIEQQYFLLFLLALQQRFVLMRLSQEVSRRWVAAGGDADESERAAAFARIHDTLLAFTAQGYFAQTMQEEHHHRCYERWLRTFELARLYDEVNAEVRVMHADLDMRQRRRAERIAEQQEQQSRRTEQRLNLFGFLVGVPVWLFVLVNSSVNIALVRSAVFRSGPVGIQWYDLLLSLALGAAGLCLGVFLYRVLSGALRRVERRRPSSTDDSHASPARRAGE